ncbi:MAG: proline dehydrogenase [Acidimicrobiia bacterium]|nr:proline dehydrogenase family protein [Acidimicrobiia bacterium]NNF09127.1 proline dehydrogenase [Acidimicrobiia bacterium]
MSLARSALLWASENETLRTHVPRWGFVQRALRQFMPGEELSDALRAAAELDERGVASMVTRLGEHLTDAAQAEEVVAHYTAAYNEIAAGSVDTEISVKPTQLGLDLDFEAAVSAVETLAGLAESRGNWLWLDMEASDYVDPTIELFRRVKASYAPVGICLQAYLHRTPSDVAALVPLRPGIRLVKGAYREPRSIALTDRTEIDEAFFRLGAELLSATADGVRLGLASHDVRLVDRLGVVAGAAGVDRDAYEIQMLYGIRMADQYRYAREGYRMRTLISYGQQWYPWYVRRLAERPANLGFVVRNLFART